MTRRWLGWLAVAAVWGVACLFLGRWQWHRWESKSTLNHELSTNYNASPVALQRALPTPQSSVTPAVEWKQVRLIGHYLGSKRLLVRNRPNNTTYGYEVVVPFRTKTGANVLVDRGWIPNGRTAQAPASVPPTPKGQVNVVGWLRPAEPNLHHGKVPGQIASINIGEVDQATGLRLHPNVYVLMRSEHLPTGSTPPRPEALPKPQPENLAGVNLSYALQWWLGMVAGFVFVLMRCRREHLDAVRGPRPAKPKKVRIWDEEDA